LNDWKFSGATSELTEIALKGFAIPATFSGFQTELPVPTSERKKSAGVADFCWFEDSFVGEPPQKQNGILKR
jgi:hypothetical protein